MKRKILFLLLPAVLLASCESNEDGLLPGTGGQEGGQIRFEIGFAPQDATPGSIPQTKAATAADFKTTWEVGDEIGIFAVKSGELLAASGNFIHNVKLTRQSDNSWKTDAGSEVYYPNNGNTLDFYAYYPYDAAMTNPVTYTFSVKANQNTGASYSLSDLLLAKKVGVAKSQNPVLLTFSHTMSLVQVEVEREITVPNIPKFDDSFTVTLEGAQTSTSIDWENTTLTNVSASTDIVMHKVDGLTNTYRALVPSQTLSADSKVSFVQTTSGREIDMEYLGIQSTSLTAKKAHRYSVTLGLGIDPNHQYAVGDPFPHVGTVIGVVFDLKNPVDNKSNHGNVVGLKEITGRWGASPRDEDADGVTSIRYNLSGKTGTRSLIVKRKEEPDFSTNYPIFNWIYQTMNEEDIDGIWYLPAIFEMIRLYQAKTSVNQCLYAVGGAVLDQVYWNAVESDATNAYAYNLSAPGGSILDLKNNTTYKGRCILSF